MSRKSFLQMSRQGQIKRIRRVMAVDNGNIRINSGDLETQIKFSQEIVEPYNETESISSGQDYISIPGTSISTPEVLPCYGEINKKNISNVTHEEVSSDSKHGEWESPTIDNDTLVHNLRIWALKYQLTHVAITALLSILRSHNCFDLPADARTLLKTPGSVITRIVEPGHYSHIGLEKNLKKIWPYVIESVNEVNLLINIDGVPLFKSSATEFWPILGSVFNIPSIKSFVFPIGVYCGTKKPSNCTIFMQEFVTEAVHLLNTGFEVCGKKIKVTIKGFVCDAPAKAFLLGIKGHNGYYSCTKCKQSGVYLQNRMTFPECDATPRTHAEFLSMSDEDFHSTTTPLTDIPGINFVNSFPLDYMHLICLGVVRTLIYLWMFGPVPLKLPRQILNAISRNLVSIAEHIPSEFNRKPRSLDDVKRWKATEFRQLLLYTGPVVLYKLKSEYSPYYNIFLSLTISITILLNPNYCYQYNDYAKSLLKHFVKTFMGIYGPQFATHNLHGLIHLSDDVYEFGALDRCSAFPFKNFLQIFKRSIRKGDRPLQQIMKRFGELSNTNFWAKNYISPLDTFPQFSKPHTSGILYPGCDESQQYKSIKFHSFEITTTHPNSCCFLNDGSVVIVNNIIFSKNIKQMVILCQEFKTKENFYNEHFMESAQIGTHIVKGLLNVCERPVSDIMCKAVLLPFQNNHVAIRMIHVIS